MFVWVRSCCFGFFGGYTMSNFYFETVRNAEAIKQDAEKSRSAMSRFFGFARDTTFSDDCRLTIARNEMPCGVALAMMVLAGGWWAAIGATAAFALEGADGPKRYADFKVYIEDVQKDVQRNVQ